MSVFASIPQIRKSMDIVLKDRIAVENFGPIQEVNVELGDLTVLIGAQASGKSIFLQMLMAEYKNSP